MDNNFDIEKLKRANYQLYKVDEMVSLMNKYAPVHYRIVAILFLVACAFIGGWTWYYISEYSWLKEHGHSFIFDALFYKGNYYFVVSFLLSITFVALIIFIKMHKRKKYKKYENMAADLFNNFSPDKDCLPVEYRFFTASDYILRVIECGRAESLNQALSMFDEYWHRCKVENSQQEILNNQKAMSDLILYKF